VTPDRPARAANGGDSERPSHSRIAERLRELLDDARLAREAGDWNQLRALARAALALDPENAEAEALLAGSAERRQMTLMFCDVVGSTAIADARDPEDLSAIMRGHRTACAEVVARFGGFIEDHQGDGMLVRFGYPEVHEDDARRAVLSALEMVRVVRARARSLDAGPAIKLRVRIAVHTDLVVLDGVGLVGATANEVSRLHDLAQPDTVVISDATHALVGEHFKVESMGQVDLRGVSRPVGVFTVLGERAGGRPGGSLGPFAGRRAELDRIETMWRSSCEDWERALDGKAPTSPRAVMVAGLAGIGKSRLVTEAARRVGASCTECRCSNYHDATSLFPFTRLLEESCGITEEDSGTKRLAKLRARLGGEPDLPFLAAALRIPASEISPPADVDPAKLRILALGAAARLVEMGAPKRPWMLFVDDLHWADQSTLDLISVLLATPRPGLLIILAARDGYEPPWTEPTLERLDLGPLRGAELEELSLLLSEQANLSAEERSELISRSDGVPLFLEELVRTAGTLDRARRLHRSLRLADYSIPPALHDPLLARLAMPGVDLDLAQTAATIGRDVDRELLRRVAGLRDDIFEPRLEGLIRAGLVDPWGDGAIRFRHELIREVAYETQRRSKRRERHSRLADHLLREGGEPTQGDAGEAAFHLERAQRYEEAIDANVATAYAYQSLGAHVEATRRLTQAVRLVAHLPDGVRERKELHVRQLRSFSAVMAGGYAAPEAAEDHSRCVDLCEELGLALELLPALIGSWSYYTFRGNLDEADRATSAWERVLEFGGEGYPSADEGGGRGVVGFFRGRFVDARRQLEAFVAHPWAHTESGPPATWTLPNDPLACMLGHLVPILSINGEHGEAQALAERALRRANELSFPYGPFSVCYVNSLLAMTRRLQGDHVGAGRLADEMVDAGERHGFMLWSLTGAIHGGLSRIHGGGHSGLNQLVESIAVWRRVVVADVWTPYWLTELAVAQRFVGRREDALHSLDESLALAAETGSEFYSAESLRVRGELRRERGDPDALDDIQGALAKAHSQQAPMFELRAAVSLARATSGSPPAREALETAIGRFSTDARHPELDEARSLAAI
jgi:class 3 adenylate cyclase/tetratricopeptide (TPR) repeat protein